MEQEVDRSTPKVIRLGEQLKAERERKGIVLDEICESTKIRKDYLQAIERHDWDALPGHVFTQSYLRSYAECLGMDSKLLLMAYARERRIRGYDDPALVGMEAQDQTKVILARLAKTNGLEEVAVPPRYKWAALGVVVIVVVGLVLWTVIRAVGEERSARVPAASSAVASATRPATGASPLSAGSTTETSQAAVQVPPATSTSQTSPGQWQLP